MWIEKGFNSVFQFNVKNGTRGYVLDCSRRYISRDWNYENIIHFLYVTLFNIL